MVAIPVYDSAGSKTREIELDASKLDKCVRKRLLKESLIAYLASQRQGTVGTRNRAKVVGHKQKPWRQKGTGRARQGSLVGPHHVGGGRAHGPQPRDYHYRLPRKQRRLAVRSSLRFRLQEGKLAAVEGLEQEVSEKPRCKAVAGFLAGAGLAGKGALLVSEGHHGNLHLSARNIQKVDVCERRQLNAGHVLQRPNLIFTAEALEALVKELEA